VTFSYGPSINGNLTSISELDGHPEAVLSLALFVQAVHPALLSHTVFLFKPDILPLGELSFIH